MRITSIICFTLGMFMITSCGQSRKTVSTSGPVIDQQIVLSVFPETNGGVPDLLELTIHNNTDSRIEFGAEYSIDRLVNGKWEKHELGDFAVIAIMYMLEPGESGKYTVSLFSDRIKYPEGEYRLVKLINVGQDLRQPFYGTFKIITPR